MKRYLTALSVPLTITVVNALIYPFLREQIPPDTAVIIMNMLRILSVVAAGWIIVMRGLGGLAMAGVAGMLLMVIDYPLISGIRYLLAGQTKGFLDILISFAVSFWIPLLLGVFGGLAARRKLKISALNDKTAE